MDILKLVKARKEAEEIYSSGEADDIYADWLCRGNASLPIANGDQLLLAMEREDNLEDFLDYYAETIVHLVKITAH